MQLNHGRDNFKEFVVKIWLFRIVVLNNYSDIGSNAFSYQLPMRFIYLLITFLLFANTSFGQIDDHDMLIKKLDTIRALDQLYRGRLNDIRSHFAGDSTKLKDTLQKQFKLMNKTDSLNLITVSAIINQYGWLSAEEIGEDANSTLFLVIQHADLKTQEKYLPIMRIAAKNKKLKASSLALLEDRIAMFQGRKQIYGSQVAWNMQTNKYTIMPMIDPDHIDTRRADIGLGSYAAYLIDLGITWDVEQYKKDLPATEKWHNKIMSRNKVKN
ncbi:DUF6624 domain-containing protein [Pedobacter miscanthi]|jgi:hypothetical protein|uniref:DUF6624 domain-containing protein n=1 Tax=Pedobacter miscanthi TaxID=2259170 RepID=UPI00292F5B5B|nr:DUF6624 domain-containing protein [Pedobacter miscanthi]